jgi:serine O-acetyltransferase
MATDVRIKEQLPELTRRIVETYQDVPTIHYLGHCPLPNYETIVSACEDLKEILYPGYRRRENLHLGNVTYHVGDLIDGLHDKLTTQIGRALRHSVAASGSGGRARRRVAGRRRSRPGTAPRRAISRRSGRRRPSSSSEKIPDLRRVLATDVQAAYDGDPAVRTLDE